MLAKENPDRADQITKEFVTRVFKSREEFITTTNKYIYNILAMHIVHREVDLTNKMILDAITLHQ